MAARTPIDTALLPTLSNAEIAHTLSMTPVRIAQLDDTVAQNPRSTIVPDASSLDSVGHRAVAGLGERSAIAEGLALGKTIGEGGMGIVRLATQRSLGRQVAVKTLKPAAHNERATLRLLREAWITGALEHPNIVPVYDLGLGDDGAPIIVLKLIEGSPWSEVAHAPSGSLPPASEDLLEKNLRILIQVCNAVSLAHARGVIHRDLKLENVMIGRFGEVYLVDWGIAVSLRPDPSGRLPLASDATEMAGTPAYMAPEMLGNGAPLSERTDVYLLGAILHELLVGKPPHAGENLRAILASIVLSKIALPASVPRDLAAIVLRACQRDPGDRFESAEALKQRVEWYLRHRGSLALSEAATQRAGEMRAAGDDRDRIHRLFAEARFGFRQALVASPDNAEATKGVSEATTWVVEWELAHGNAEAAFAALAELQPPPAELAARVNAARTIERNRRAALEKLGADLDTSTGQRTRMAAGLMVGATWTLVPEVGGWWFHQHPDTSYRTLYLGTAVLALFAWAIGRWGRESLFKTAINRHMIAITIGMFGLMLTMQLGGSLMDLPWNVILPLHIFVWFTAMVNACLFVERRFWVSTVVFFVGFVWSALVPPHVFHAMALVSGSLMVTLLVIWWRPREDAVYFVAQMKERKRRLVEGATDLRDEGR